MKKIITPFLLLFLFLSANSQINSFQNFYYSQQSEKGTSCDVMINKNIAVCGITQNAGANFPDIFLMEVNPSTGIILWSKSYGTVGDDKAYSVKQTSDGGFIIAGSTNGSSGGAKNALLIKTNSTGTITWSKVFGGALTDEFFSVTEVPSNGGYVACGYTYDVSNGGVKTDAFVVKVNTSGVAQWEAIYGGLGDDVVRSVIIAPNGDVVCAGSRTVGAGTGTDVYILNLASATGARNWSNTLRGSGMEEIYSIIPDGTSGNYLLVGHTDSYATGSGSHILLQTVTSTGLSSGNVLFGNGTDQLEAYDVVRTSAGKYGIIGSNLGMTTKHFLVELDATKSLTYFGSYQGIEPHEVVATSDGLYVTAGSFTKPSTSTNSVYLDYLSKDAGHPSPCMNTFDPLSISTQILTTFAPSDTFNVYSTTYTVSLTTGDLIFVGKDVCNPTAIEKDLADVNFSVYPNPSNGILNISRDAELNHEMQISIISLTGMQVAATQILRSGIAETRIDLSGIAAGIYFVKVQMDGFNTAVRKIVIE